ncbi:xanthine dehydrogenase family protein molybdopterin-binding subunit [Actinoplanes sp. NPDC089786]|uniref:xanthine dehydrogenase family protein molybdopterin-binding subunit n=1 Tax=Actinoplanes sp. NPDC089786 TaxID=3155185 RepID=UPI003437806C
MSKLVGRDVARVDGRAKVTGAATYAADHQITGTLFGFLVLGTITRGELTDLDTAEAKAMPGVVAVYTHADMPRFDVSEGFYLKGFVPMQDTTIHHNGQPIAMVVAATFEQAREAADRVRATYRTEPHVLSVTAARDDAYLPPPMFGEPNEVTRGDAAAALASAPVRLDRSYTAPTHHHNPIEPHATTAVWDGDDRLTLFESSQAVVTFRDTLAGAFGLAAGNVRVIAPYLGGGFGTKGVVWPHTLITAAAARLAGRPVKTVLTRAQMFTGTGHRTEFQQRIRLGAGRDGRLTAIVHDTIAQLTATDENMFNSSIATHTLYACPNVHVRQLGVRLDMPTGAWMRSPDMSAQFALETSLDELSYQIGVDPLDLRLRNYARTDQNTGDRFTGKHLDDCYRMGAEKFGWRRRERRPGVTRDGDEYVGWGMATETHTYGNFPASAGVTLGVDGAARVAVASQDIGTGTYTVISQVAADAMDLPLARVTTVLGDTILPPAGSSSISSTMPSVIPSVDKAARDVRAAVIKITVADRRSPLHGVPADRVTTSDGRLADSADPSRSDTYRDVLRRHGKPVEVIATVENTPGHTYGAVFVEARVHRRYGNVRVTRVVGAYDVGRVLNRRTLRSQVIGGVTWGIGYALMEHTLVDQASGRIVNPNLSTYLVPVNADAPPRIDALFVDEPDPGSAGLGAKGFGETPITGVAVAIGNAIFHATGRRLRDVPFTQDKLL